MLGKIYVLLACVALPLSLAGQGAPRWLSSAGREQAYPAAAWFTGFAEGNVRPNEAMPAAVARLKREAQGLLAEGIRVSVESSTNARSVSERLNRAEQLTAIFESAVSTAAKADVTGIKTESWLNADEGTLYAFAWVNKAELAAYYRSQISLHLNKVESALTTASELAEKGMKAKARRQCEEVVRGFAAVSYAQDLLTAIDAYAGEAALQQQRGEHLRNALIQTLTDLENSTYVYVECREAIDDEEVTYIADRLSGLLTESDCECSFTNMEDQADYVVRVNARLARCADATGSTVFCYANGTVSLYNAHTQKTLKPKIGEAKGDWTNKSYAKAAEEAFDELAKKIAAKVAPMLKN
jgi:hypothetical protein